MSKSVLIVGVGVGVGLGFALARAFSGNGHRVGMAARDTDKLADLQQEIGADSFRCDVTDPHQVSALFDAAVARLGSLDVVVFNANARRRGIGANTRGPLPEIDSEAVKQSLLVNSFGGFLVGQAAARVMLPRGRGTILFMGASASVKGYPQSPTFAMAKFALRGLAQSMARELGPQGIHVAHVIIDGVISGSIDRCDLPSSDRAATQQLDPRGRYEALDRKILVDGTLRQGMQLAATAGGEGSAGRG